jgi:thioredoxin 1
MMSVDYLGPEQAPSRDDIDRGTGLVLLEFGTDWCPICRALAPYVSALLQQHPQVRHVKVEDGPGRPLGRSFRVRLWPNLVFLQDGVAVRQLARPTAAALKEAFAALVGGDSSAAARP